MPAGWLEIDILQTGSELSVIARGSQGEQVAQYPLGPDITSDTVAQFAEWVQEAASTAQSLEDVVPKALALDKARALHQAIFQGALNEVLIRKQADAKDQPILVRFMPQSPRLQGIPWEALCKPGTTMDFLGTSQKVSLVRGVHSTREWKPHPVKGAVRVLVISPSDEGAPERLRAALRSSIDAGEISWLKPLTGAKARAGAVLDVLRLESAIPDILHFIGHGDVDEKGAPRLRMADSDGQPSWLKVELLAQELEGRFADNLRLIVLEACKGAQPGTLASAAEFLARSGADAVVAHLWPVKADVARRCSESFYRSLTGAAARSGDVVRSLHNARRTVLVDFQESAEAFSPVLYLRGNDSTLFDFQSRKTHSLHAPAPADPGAAAASAANELRTVMQKPCSLLLGDHGPLQLPEGFRKALSDELKGTPRQILDSLPLSALAQRYALAKGEEAVSTQFQARLRNAAASLPLIDALAKRLGPGVHITLLRTPLLEDALVRYQPELPLYVIQPSRSGDRSITILPHTAQEGWGMPLTSLDSFDPRREAVVLRLYRGYMPTGDFASPLLTEDDYLQGVRDLDSLLPAGLSTTIKSVLAFRPTLLLGMSVLSWDHRHLLNRLFDHRPLPQDSLALLEPGNPEGESWEIGRGLPGGKRVRPLQVGLTELAQSLDPQSSGDAS